MRENMYYIQKKNIYIYIYILKLLLNVVTTRNEALVSGNTFFFMHMSKKSAACELGHILTPSPTHYF
jgi:hypothetical protein